MKLSRRESMRTATAALLPPVLMPTGLLLPGVSRPEGNGAERGCTLGFSTYGMKNLPTEKAIQIIGEIGFDAVELTVWEGWDADSARMNRKRRLELRQRIADSGLYLTSLMEHVTLLGAGRQKKAIQRLKHAGDLAHDLVPESPPILQTVLGSGNFSSQRNELRDHLGEWIRLAKSNRSVIAIKPHRGGVVSRPSEAVWLFEQLGKPERLRMVYDYSHYAFRNLSIQQTVQTALPFTSHVAVKDAVQQKDRVVFKLPGENQTIDFAEIIRTFHAGGYRRDINCEVSGMVWNQKGYDPQVAARTCYRNMAKAFRQADVPRKHRG
ncbi:MAG: sugar phosphate isomerase/epimerase [Planctomycetota bacterium]|nr:sugar phosphate isomerase/epimerase [Planctomycetota bacterium]